LAALNIDHLQGGLAFFAVAWPLDTLAGHPVSDRAQAVVSFGVVFLVSFLLLYLIEASQAGAGHRRFPVGASMLGVLLICESLYLAVGSVPHDRFGEFARNYYLPWHLAVLALTAVYIFWRRSREFRVVRRLFWLTVVVLCLAVLFPWTDSF
jgi:hypothetical protein